RGGRRAAARVGSGLGRRVVAHVAWACVVIALVCTLAWGWLVVKSERSVSFRSVTFWAAGITLLWALGMTLLLQWIDYGKSYRAVALALKKNIPVGTRCVESRGLDEAQRALFDYLVARGSRRAAPHGNAG